MIDLKGEESETTGGDGSEAHAEGVGGALEGAGRGGGRAAHGGVAGGHGGSGAVGGRGGHGGGGHGRGSRGGANGGRRVGADAGGERGGLGVGLAVALEGGLADAVGDAVDLCRRNLVSCGFFVEASLQSTRTGKVGGGAGRLAQALKGRGLELGGVGAALAVEVGQGAVGGGDGVGEARQLFIVSVNCTNREFVKESTYSARGDVGELVELGSGKADGGRDGDGDELHVDECWCLVVVVGYEKCRWRATIIKRVKLSRRSGCW